MFYFPADNEANICCDNEPTPEYSQTLDTEYSNANLRQLAIKLKRLEGGDVRKIEDMQTNGNFILIYIYNPLTY